ncbi:MAG: hypothetical protein A2144_11785 [Chloroflexi bacterium RBG_16_50_9]|nr:MAG: hypothetical protein A2144_11785 [Chloroflexi bacterium RBG_16_50_9]
MDEILIAPCGMNCNICTAHLRKERACPGCRVVVSNKPPTRTRCVIKNCAVIKTNRSGFCYECDAFPCARMQRLDKRYRTFYHMSEIANLVYIKEHGIVAFLKKEAEKWRCPECGGGICCHNGICYTCGLEKLRAKKHKLRWEE